MNEDRINRILENIVPKQKAPDGILEKAYRRKKYNPVRRCLISLGAYVSMMQARRLHKNAAKAVEYAPTNSRRRLMFAAALILIVLVFTFANTDAIAFGIRWIQEFFQPSKLSNVYTIELDGCDYVSDISPQDNADIYGAIYQYGETQIILWVYPLSMESQQWYSNEPHERFTVANLKVDAKYADCGIDSTGGVAEIRTKKHRILITMIGGDKELLIQIIRHVAH